MRNNLLFILILCCTISAQATAQTDSTLLKKVEQLQKTVADYEHRFDILEKQIDDIQWFNRLSDVAHVDKVRLTSTPRWKPKDKKDRFAGNKFTPTCSYQKTSTRTRNIRLSCFHTAVYTPTFQRITITLFANCLRKAMRWFPPNIAEVQVTEKTCMKTSITADAKTTMCSKAETT